MKKIILGITFSLPLFCANAQYVEITPQAGVTVNKNSMFAPMAGLKAGADIIIGFNNNIGIQTGLFYTQRKSGGAGTDVIRGHREGSDVTEYYFCTIEPKGTNYSNSTINRIPEDFVIEGGSIHHIEKRNDFLQIPIRLQYSIRACDKLKFDFGAGMYLGYGISGKRKEYITDWSVGGTPSSDEKTDNPFKTGDDRFDYGASFLFRIQSNKLNIIAGADLRLYERKANKDRTYYLGAGYSF